ncbi:MAG TPA: hypothetical protein VIM16_05515 [Mucilaginibacter sp.]|jgi:hypothetical protein
MPAKIFLQLSLTLCLFLTVEHGWGQSHGSTGFNDTTYMLTYDHGGQILWGLEHFREKLNNAREWLDKYPNFKIGLENEAHVYDYFAEKDPAMLTQIRRMLKKYRGRFGIGSCSYGQPLACFINEESNIRQIKYALEAERKYFSYRPPVYLMSEHAMHSQLPQILKSFGFKGAILRTHFMMYGYNPTFNVAIGNWVGMDGSKIPAIPTYTGEGAAFGTTTIDDWTLTRYPGENAVSPLQFRQKFNYIHPLLASRADDSGLRQEALVDEYKDQPKFQWVLLDDLLSKYPVPAEDMPTKPNDFVVRMPWGYCGNEIWNESRKAEVQVLTAERLAALELICGGKNHEAALEHSWKNLLVGQHHDIQIVGLLSSAKTYLPASQHYSRRVLDSALQFFAARMKGEGVSQATVFNPLSWSQKKWISVKVSGAEKGAANSYKVKCGEKEFPARLYHPDYYSDKSILDGELLFEAELAPLSVTSFSIVPQKEKDTEKAPGKIVADADNLRISTPFAELQLAENGGIKSLKQKASGYTFSSSEGPIAYFEGTIDGIDCKSKGKWVIQKYDGAAPFVTATEYGMIGGIPYRFEIMLSEDDPLIECKVSFDINGQKIGLLSQNQRDSHSPFVHDQKLRFKFFPGLQKGQVTAIRDLPFAIAETSDSTVQGNYWTALSDGQKGIAFFNKGTMGSMREPDGCFSMPLAYAMYYVWGTRMLNGTYSYEFALYPFSGAWQNAGLHKKAIAYNFPLPVVQTPPGDGKMGFCYQLFENQVNDPVLSALYTEKGKPIARFYEYEGKNCQVNLFSKDKNYLINEISLDGVFKQKEKENTAFGPWQIKTFELLKLKK